MPQNDDKSHGNQHAAVYCKSNRKRVIDIQACVLLMKDECHLRFLKQARICRPPTHYSYGFSGIKSRVDIPCV